MSKLYVGLFQHDPTSDFSNPVVGEYASVLEEMGKRWQQYGLGFAAARLEPFYVDQDSGYTPKVRIYRSENGHIQWVAHADGGCVIHIMEATQV